MLHIYKTMLNFKALHIQVADRPGENCPFNTGLMYGKGQLNSWHGGQ